MSGKLAQCLRHIRRAESGSAMVETALTFPIFIALLLGAVELGDFAYKADEMTSAARSAAQYAAANGGAYTDCNGSIPGSTYVTCTAPSGSKAGSGIYATAQNDATLTYKSCTNFAVQAATSCTCGSSSDTCAPATNGGYVCTTSTGAVSRAVIMVQIHTSAQCSPSAVIPNLFPTGTTFTLSGYSQQEVTQ